MRYFHPVSEPHSSGDKEGGVNPQRGMEQESDRPGG